MSVDPPAPARAATASGPLIMTADDDLLDHALVAVAAAGAEADVVADHVAARQVWATEGPVLLGIDLARGLQPGQVPRGRRLLLIGGPGTSEDLCELSVGWQAAALVLPDHLARLTAVLAEPAGGPSGARVVAVLGGSGGVGASTVAAALACRVAESDPRPGGVGLLDLDPVGGGLDLCLGAEAEPGWRWPRLAGVGGHLDGLRDRLPVVDEVSVVSIDRDDAAPLLAETVDTVVDSCRPGMGLIVLDVGRGDPGLTRFAVGRADHTLLVTGDEIRQVAACRALLGRLAGVLGSWTLAVRVGAGPGVAHEIVADTLGHPVDVVVPAVRSMRTAALRGEPPHRVHHRRWRAAVGSLVAAVAP